MCLWAHELWFSNQNTDFSFPELGYGWLGVLHTMCMASDISDSAQACIDNGHTAGDFTVGRFTRTFSTEHSTIAITKRLQFEKWFQLFANAITRSRMQYSRMSYGGD